MFLCAWLQKPFLGQTSIYFPATFSRHLLIKKKSEFIQSVWLCPFHTSRDCGADSACQLSQEVVSQGMIKFLWGKFYCNWLRSRAMGLMFLWNIVLATCKDLIHICTRINIKKWRALQFISEFQHWIFFSFRIVLQALFSQQAYI